MPIMMLGLFSAVVEEELPCQRKRGNSVSPSVFFSYR